MLRMVRSCDRTQRKLAIFLIVVIVTEIYLICRIVEHEHHTAHAEQGHLVKKGARLSSDQEGSRSMIPKRKHSLAEVRRKLWYMASGIVRLSCSCLHALL